MVVCPNRSHGLSLRKVFPVLGFLLTAFSLAPSAQAGSWQFSVTGTMNASTSPASTPPTYKLPSPSTGSLSLPSYNLYGYVPVGAGQTASGNADFSLPLTVTATWVPYPNLTADPAPAVLRVVESASTTWSVTGGCFTVDTTGSTASDGLDDACVSNYYSGTSSGSSHIRNLPVTNSQASWTVTLSAHASVTIAHAPFNTGCGVNAYLNSYSVSAVSLGVKVDQDLQIFAPAATTHFSATLTNSIGLPVDWVKISVDGATPLPATMTPNSPNNYYINWDSSTALNPSEHTVVATAQVHDSAETISLDSTAASGNGRVADDIIADVRLQSLYCPSAYPLRNCASAVPAPNPDPALVPAQTFVWNQDRSQTSAWNVTNNPTGTFSVPADNVQGAGPGFLVSPFAWTGNGATMGFQLKVQATPNTGDTALTLYDNTGSDPAKLSSSGSAVASATPLYPKVAKYTLTVSALSVWAEFTHVTPNIWKQVGPSYASTAQPLNSTLYALWAQPQQPMDQPWTRVLDLACAWAAGDTSASAATHDLVTNEYLHCTYNGGHPADTAIPTVPLSGDSEEIFYLSDFLIGTTRPNAGILQGQCNDFSDFLSCLSNAIGARELQPVRTQTILAIKNPVDPSSFTTNLLLAANALPPTPTYSKNWNYHQFTNDINVSGGAIFDGCLRLNGTTIVENLAGPALGSAYYTAFIASTGHPTDPSKDWSPGPPLVVIIQNSKPQP